MISSVTEHHQKKGNFCDTLTLKLLNCST
jgi:hypothetical protein